MKIARKHEDGTWVPGVYLEVGHLRGVHGVCLIGCIYVKVCNHGEVVVFPMNV